MPELFHVFNRGVDKRKIFLDERDHFRFIHDLFEFNDKENVNSTFYIYNNVIARRCIGREEHKKKRNLLVQIHAFCLMENHYHLLLSPVIDKGITYFIKKLNMGYARYFNEKYKRKGALFEGRAKRVIVSNESHFIHLPYYIDLNPLDLVMPKWRIREIKNYKKAIEFLKGYRWSSHLDYLGEKNFPSVTQRDFLLNFFGGQKNYAESIQSWLKELDLDALKGVTFD